MGKAYPSSPGAFNSDDLRLLSSIYEEVCQSLAEEESVTLTPQVRDIIAAAVVSQVAKGERCPWRLRSRALRVVEAYHGVSQTNPGVPRELFFRSRP